MKETYTAVDPIERVHALECEKEALRAKLSQVSKDMEYIAKDRDNMKEKIIAQLQSVAESMPCITLAQAIEIVEDL